MNDITNICTGCCACMNTCPKNCISMKENEYGEIEPTIDKDKCINCGLCKKICPSNKNIELKKIKKCYAAWNLDTRDRNNSSSGGIATLLAEKFLEDKESVVVGSSFNEKLKLNHIMCNNKEELKKLQGSKYLQSYIGNIYKEVQEKLKQNIKVMFVGTPCQVSGLYSFLNCKNIENLITIDIVCHGVPPSKYFEEYIKKYQKSDDEIINVRFRDKKGYNLIVEYESGKKYVNEYWRDMYLYAFCKSIILRENCYQCKYAQPNRIGDITLGDYWGIGILKPFRHKKNKVSEIFVNTEKGQQLIEKYSKYMFLEERPKEEAISWNGQLNKPSYKDKLAIEFKEYYKEYGFNKALENCCIRKKMKKERMSIKRMIGKLYQIKQRTILKLKK